jgi:DNA modification methylase
VIHHGECVEIMAGMEPESVDAIVTDPPYGLEFMGKAWDRLWTEQGGRTWQWGNHGTLRAPSYKAGLQAQAWHEAWAREALRVAKPGAYLLAFGGTRTVHRLACAIEDAGWIIRDTLVWAYAQGFPKSKASLKPAWEPIVMARKPGPLRELAIDACRIGTTVETWPVSRSYAPGQMQPGGVGATEATGDVPAGRWPANVILTDPIFDGGIEGVVGGGESVGVGGFPAVDNQQRQTYGGFTGEREAGPERTDAGTYSRFFLIPKADRADREPVLGGGTPSAATSWDKPLRECNVCGSRTKPSGPDPVPWPACGHDDWRWEMARLKPRVNTHATVKPTELMRHLVRLVTPFGGTVLDPFAGSGSTLIAAEQEGFAWIGIEKEAEYVAIAEARLNGTQRGLGLDVPAPTEKRGKMPPHVGPGTTWWDSVKRYGDEPSGEDAA